MIHCDLATNCTERVCEFIQSTNKRNGHTKHKIARRTATLSSHLAHVHKDKRGSHKLAKARATERETRRKRKGLELRSQSILTAHLLQLE